MIGSTLEFIAKELNHTICQRLKINPSTNKVLLTNIVDPDGSIAVKDNNVLLLKLVNIEPDPIANGSEPNVHFPRGSDLVKAAPLYLNLKLVLAAYVKSEQVQAGLDMLTMGIGYLQGKQMWNPQNTPGLPADVNRLIFEMESLDLHQLNHLWGVIGTKYLPSVIYKLKMLTIDDEVIRAEVPGITEVSTDVNKTDPSI